MEKLTELERLRFDCINLAEGNILKAEQIVKYVLGISEHFEKQASIADAVD